MRFRRELMEGRQYILWGKVRHIYEFAYMFESFHFRGYVSTDDNSRYEIDLPKLQLQDLQELDDKEIELIICDLEVDDYISILKERKLIGKFAYKHFEEFFCLLDQFNSEILAGRKIAVWGTGETERNFQEACRENGYTINVDTYIDGNIEKRGSSYCGRPIKMISDVGDIKQYFIIVASIYYYDIKEELSKYGLIEGKDYLSFSCFYSKPSAMLKELVRAEEMRNFYCDRPYTWFYYAWFGVYSCCSTWVKYPIGNPASDLPEECWNSIVAKLYRLSADTRTYCFCKKDACGVMGNTSADKQKPGDCSIPEKITLGLDYTCNLHCTSCRNHTQVASGDQLRIREQFAENIIRTGWLEKTKMLELSGAGEALFSKIDRNLLFSNNGCKRESVSLLTNGILLNEDNLKKLKEHFKTVYINISIDAATEETYKKIRRGGDWNVLQDNLDKVRIMKQNNEIAYVEIRMVVQRNNYKEMVDFIKMGKKYCVDRVVFTKLLNWDMYETENYLEEAMLNKDGSLNEELRSILQMDIFKEKIVQISEFNRFL